MVGRKKRTPSFSFFSLRDEGSPHVEVNWADAENASPFPFFSLDVEENRGSSLFPPPSPPKKGKGKWSREPDD